MKNSKKAFSLIELIFIIAVIAIIVAVAVPKLMDSKSNALANSLKQDITTITNSIQSYHMLNNSISNIEDAVTIDPNRWEIENKKAVFNIDTEPCITIEVNGTKLTVNVNTSPGDICKKLLDNGIVKQSFDLF